MKNSNSKRVSHIFMSILERILSCRPGLSMFTQGLSLSFQTAIYCVYTCNIIFYANEQCGSGRELLA